MAGIKVFSVAGANDSISRAARFRKTTRDLLDGGCLTISSQTGRTLAAAVEWCEENGLPYTIQAVPGAMYALHVDEKP